MQIKIISDGHPRNTHVVNAETGEPILGVRVIDWHMDLNGVATATIEFIRVSVELVGTLKIAGTSIEINNIKTNRE